MASRQAFHQPAEIRDIIPGIDDQVDVVGHQAVAIDAQLQFIAELDKRVQLSTPVSIAEEDILLVVTPLDEMVRIVGQRKAGKARHPCLRVPVPLG